MRQGRIRFIAGMLAIPVSLFLVFVISPFIQAIQISFTSWSGYTPTKTFVGLANFRALLQDEVLWTALKHVLLALAVIPASTIALALFFATMLTVGGSGKRSGSGVGGSSFYKFVYFFPQMLSVAIISVLWMFIYDSTANGPLNSILAALGVAEPISWLGDPDTALLAIFAVVIWAGVGFYVVLFRAAMDAIPRELYEAASLDGASRWDAFRRVTVPLIWDTLQVSLVFAGIAALDLFGVVMIMSMGPGGPGDSTQTVALHLYQQAFTFGKFGYASAIGVVLLILNLLLAALTFRVTRRERLEF